MGPTRSPDLTGLDPRIAVQREDLLDALEHPGRH